MQTLLPPPPPLPAGPPAPRTYHRLDLRRLSLLEGWRIGRSPFKVLILWWSKLTGQNLGAGGALPSPRPLADSLLASHEVPPSLAGPLEALRRECEAAGFAEPVLHGYKDDLSSVDAAGCLLHDPAGEVLAVLGIARPRNGVSPAQPARCFFLSPLTDGRLLITSNGPAAFKQPPGDDTARLVDAPVAALDALHRRRLEVHRTRGNPPRPVRTFEGMAALYDANEHRSHDFHVARGVYVPLTANEVASRRSLHDAKRFATGSAADALEAEETVAVLEALHRREHRAASPGGQGFLLLLVSLLAFAVAGWLRWSPSLVAMIIGVLFLHEGGHYLAMRGFGYRNVRMFFVPFLGAAVSGLDPRAPGWQKGVVALAGPLPGLALAALVILGQRWLPSTARVSPGNLIAVRTAFVALGINGFNLLPLLPLDGGRVLHETLFCRHPLLRVGFVGLAGAGLLALGLNGAGTLLTVLGGLMLGSIPAVWRIGQAARSLQASALAPTDPGPAKDVRPEVLPAVLAALKRNRQSPPKRAVLANEAVAVIDLLRARPPGAAATAALLAAYVAAWALAVGPVWPVLASRVRKLTAPTHERARLVHPPRSHPPATPAPDGSDA